MVDRKQTETATCIDPQYYYWVAMFKKAIDSSTSSCASIPKRPVMELFIASPIPQLQVFVNHNNDEKRDDRTPRIHPRSFQQKRLERQLLRASSLKFLDTIIFFSFSCLLLRAFLFRIGHMEQIAILKNFTTKIAYLQFQSMTRPSSASSSASLSAFPLKSALHTWASSWHISLSTAFNKTSLPLSVWSSALQFIQHSSCFLHIPQRPVRSFLRDGAKYTTAHKACNVVSAIFCTISTYCEEIPDSQAGYA